VPLVTDTFKRKQTEDELRLAAISFESQDGMVVTDANGIILRVNKAFTRLTGYSEEEAVGRNPALLSSGRYDKAFYLRIWATLKEKYYWQGEMYSKRKNGKIHAEWLAISAVTSPEGKVTNYVGSLSESTRSMDVEAEMHRLANFDPVTHLPNRRMLLQCLEETIIASSHSGRHGALLFLDLDNFKTLNNMRDHNIGDMLLTEVAERLKASVRGYDTVTRLGGDEFVLLLENLSKDDEEAAIQAGLVGEQVRDAIALPYILKGVEFICTSSIGICMFHGHNVSAEDLLKHADLAMCQAKEEGRNSLRFFNPEMQATLVEHSTLEGDLRHALEQQQLHLYYQMQVDSARRIIGAEALLRWDHPERGMIMPGDFIHIAEESGLILPIGYWVLKSACEQIKIWSASPDTRDLWLAVNVSARQFHQAGFVEQVQRALDESGADPSRLKLELTESLVLDDVSDTVTKMYALKELGISFAMDDFGTGYSSLTYLKQLPLDQLKIDQSFIRDLSTDPSDVAIVQAIITMGRTFELNVISEGVETEEQFEFLDNHGSHAFQGFLFGRPVPLGQFETSLTLQ
jgi:diguanylate cyclase (GGDEF)-like protein/PAS domain S-box-containing protein